MSWPNATRLDMVPSEILAVICGDLNTFDITNLYAVNCRSLQRKIVSVKCVPRLVVALSKEPLPVKIRYFLRNHTGLEELVLDNPWNGVSVSKDLLSDDVLQICNSHSLKTIIMRQNVTLVRPVPKSNEFKAFPFMCRFPLLQRLELDRNVLINLHLGFIPLCKELQGLESLSLEAPFTSIQCLPLHSLVSLTISQTSSGEQSIEQTFSRLVFNHPNLKHLHLSLSIWGRNSQHPAFSTESKSPPLELPFETLTIYGNFFPKTISFPLLTPHLHTITLTPELFSSSLYAPLVKNNANLRTLHLVPNPGSTCSIALEEFTESLPAQLVSLHIGKLQLDTVSASYNFFQHIPRGLTHLELESHLPQYLGWGDLPTTLESLILIQPDLSPAALLGPITLKSSLQCRLKTMELNHLQITTESIPFLPSSLTCVTCSLAGIWTIEHARELLKQLPSAHITLKDKPVVLNESPDEGEQNIDFNEFVLRVVGSQSRARLNFCWGIDSGSKSDVITLKLPMSTTRLTAHFSPYSIVDGERELNITSKGMTPSTCFAMDNRKVFGVADINAFLICIVSPLSNLTTLVMDSGTERFPVHLLRTVVPNLLHLDLADSPLSSFASSFLPRTLVSYKSNTEAASDFAGTSGGGSERSSAAPPPNFGGGTVVPSSGGFGRSSAAPPPNFGGTVGPSSGGFGRSSAAPPPNFGGTVGPSSGGFGRSSAATTPPTFGGTVGNSSGGGTGTFRIGFGSSSAAPPATFGGTVGPSSGGFGRPSAAPPPNFGGTVGPSTGGFGRSSAAPPATFGGPVTDTSRGGIANSPASHHTVGGNFGRKPSDFRPGVGSTASVNYTDRISAIDFPPNLTSFIAPGLVLGLNELLSLPTTLKSLSVASPMFTNADIKAVCDRLPNLASSFFTKLEITGTYIPDTVEHLDWTNLQEMTRTQFPTSTIPVYLLHKELLLPSHLKSLVLVPVSEEILDSAEPNANSLSVEDEVQYRFKNVLDNPDSLLKRSLTSRSFSNFPKSLTKLHLCSVGILYNLDPSISHYTLRDVPILPPTLTDLFLSPVVCYTRNPFKSIPDGMIKLALDFPEPVRCATHHTTSIPRNLKSLRVHNLMISPCAIPDLPSSLHEICIYGAVGWNDAHVFELEQHIQPSSKIWLATATISGARLPSVDSLSRVDIIKLTRDSFASQVTCQWSLSDSIRLPSSLSSLDLEHDQPFQVCLPKLIGGPIATAVNAFGIKFASSTASITNVDTTGPAHPNIIVSSVLAPLTQLLTLKVDLPKLSIDDVSCLPQSLLYLSVRCLSLAESVDIWAVLPRSLIEFTLLEWLPRNGQVSEIPQLAEWGSKKHHASETAHRASAFLEALPPRLEVLDIPFIVSQDSSGFLPPSLTSLNGKTRPNSIAAI